MKNAFLVLLQLALAVAALPSKGPVAEVPVEIIKKGTISVQSIVKDTATPLPKFSTNLNNPGPHPTLDPVFQAEDTVPTTTFASTVADTKTIKAFKTTLPVVKNRKRSGTPVKVEENAGKVEFAPHLVKRGATTISNILVPISTAAPPAVFIRKTTHPIPRDSITSSNVPLHTNKFYSNFFVGTRSTPVYVQPYQVWWSNGAGEGQDNHIYGLSVSHTDERNKGWGDDHEWTGGTAPQFYYSFPYMRSLNFGASELSAAKSTFTFENLRPFSVVGLLWENRALNDNRIKFHFCLGAALLSAEYRKLTPVFESSIGIRKIEGRYTVRTNIYKYKIYLQDGKVWVIYAFPTPGVTQSAFTLTLVNSKKVAAASKFQGIIQIARISKDGAGGENSAAEQALDASAGSQCEGVEVSAGVAGTVGTYKLKFFKNSNSAPPLLMYALPHHVSSFDTATRNAIKAGVTLTTPTKGIAKAVAANEWTLQETNLPVNMGWFPARRDGQAATFSAAKLAKIVGIVKKEAAEDMYNQTTVEISHYYNGKALTKFAQVCLVSHEIVKDRTVTTSCLNSLKKEYARFTSNTNITNQFIYESQWGGVVTDYIYSSRGPLNPGYDFGAGIYNDHHFHWSYFIYAGAVISYIDKAITGQSNWLNANRDWINTLVRDYANPSFSDKFFPQFRAFDFWHGHSWASGLVQDRDGKNEESSSEDVFSAYALKMWGLVSGNAPLEQLGNLQLSILKRALNDYMIFTPGTSQGSEPHFQENLVSGILWENKADHTTHFGYPEEVHKTHGIHMLPLNPASPFIKTAAWAQREWNLYFNGKTTNITDGWRGVLHSNVMLWNPTNAFDFFTQDGFKEEWLDQGASRSWYLACAGMMGGAA